MEVFSNFHQWRQKVGLPWILDSACGAGEGTLHLASQFPGHAVVGVDKSLSKIRKAEKRWQKHPELQERILFLRADLIDFWRLLKDKDCGPDRHYLYYPEPWPKKKHLRRRWHGHPVFPTLIDLSPHFEMRSDWQLYLQEFAQAVLLSKGKSFPVRNLGKKTPVTSFERKHLLMGRSLYSLDMSFA